MYLTINQNEFNSQRIMSTTDIAKESGLSKRVAQQRIQIAKGISEEVT